jgi:hypothetical protein
VEVEASKPALVLAKDRLDFPLWVGGLFHETVKLTTEPSGTIIQTFDDQAILVWEMRIHRHFGHVGLGNDPIDACGAKARAYEQRIGDFDDVLEGMA